MVFEGEGGRKKEVFFLKLWLIMVWADTGHDGIEQWVNWPVCAAFMLAHVCLGHGIDKQLFLYVKEN